MVMLLMMMSATISIHCYPRTDVAASPATVPPSTCTVVACFNSSLKQKQKMDENELEPVVFVVRDPHACCCHKHSLLF